MAIEVLVCQDKLKACNAHVKWVSSELQYSDSMTKVDAAQLLADRLRTHLVRVKSDETYQAAIKKDAKTRHKNTETFAVKKGSRAMQAMFMLGSTTTTLATNNYTELQHNHGEGDWHYILTFLITLVIIFDATIWFWRQQFLQHPPDNADQSETKSEDTNVSDEGIQIEGNETTNGEVNTDLDFPAFEMRLNDTIRRANDLQVENLQARRAHEDLQQHLEVLKNDREKLIKAFQALTDEYNRVKTDRQRLREHLTEMKQVLHDTRFNKDQFVKERVVNLMDQIFRQPLWVSICGTRYHLEHECVTCRSTHEVKEFQPCSHCTGCMGRALLRRAREVYGLPTDSEYWSDTS